MRQPVCVVECRWTPSSSSLMSIPDFIRVLKVFELVWAAVAQELFRAQVFCVLVIWAIRHGARYAERRRRLEKADRLIQFDEYFSSYPTASAGRFFALK